MRFVAASDDAIAFVRETADETVLVHASRGPHEPLRIRRGDLGMAGDAERLYGDGDLIGDRWHRRATRGRPVVRRLADLVGPEPRR